MLTADFDFELPESLIAQHPPERRDGGRLLISKAPDGLTDALVRDLPRVLPDGALLVVNDSKVFAARILARRETGALVEMLLLRRVGPERWNAMLRRCRGLKRGENLRLLIPSEETSTGVAEYVDSNLACSLLEAPANGRCTVHLDSSAIDTCGNVPLPPYIKRAPQPEDRDRYQTVYARQEGSVAAPTAGLHLSEAIMTELHERPDVDVTSITLHVGPGTFTPVRADRIQDHSMEKEHYSLSPLAEESIAKAKEEGRPVVAVGTTVVRCLEASGGRAGDGCTDLFVVPGYQFKIVDMLLTNFHLPRSTLLMLVSALGGQERIKRAYAHAIAAGYRFYSYGDAMLIL